MKTLWYRLAKFIVTPTDCWEWAASRNPAGYGQVMVFVDGKYKPIAASRAAYITFKGDVPKGMDVCHSCDNPPCINPNHLFLGTRKENLQDAKSKGRLPLGANRPNSKLTDVAVRKMREIAKSGGVTQRKIASDFGISVGVVNAVINGKRWSHVAAV